MGFNKFKKNQKLLQSMLSSIIEPAHSEEKFHSYEIDILIFLTKKEVSELGVRPLKGKIFRYRDLREIYELEILVNNELNQKKFESGLGWSIENNKYLISVSPHYHKELQKTGWIGARSSRDSKIDIITYTYAKKDYELSKWLKSIKFKHENKDKNY